ncbi:MAG: ATPase [Sphingomonadales bacterium]|nr:ATPase [Sphingomonadales bacterium]
MSKQPAYFEAVRHRSQKRWEQLEADPELAGPWHQLFKQVQSPRHILSELLQNADDAGATEAHAQIDGDAFVFEHNGEDFTEEHFASLCRFGYSNKRALHTIGFRGIGFKSTFSLGDKVELYTPTLSVGFDRARFTEPFWIDGKKASKGATTVRVEILDRHRKIEVEKNLADWTKSPVSLLFFKNIRKIRIGEELIHWVACGEGPVKGSQWLAQHDNLEKKFLLARSEPESFPEEALDEIRQERLLSTEQEMEFPPCQIEIVIGVEGRLFVVLPTGVETDLPFAVNAPFIQDPTRFKIKSPSTSPTNRWLLERAGKLAADVLKNWLQRADLPLADRARAYDAMPDVDRKKTSLDSACGTLVEESFEVEIAEAAIALTEDGACVQSQEAVLLPREIFEVWPQKQAIGFFDEASRPAIAMAVSAVNLEKLKHWNVIEEIEPQTVLRRLQDRHFPQPKAWQNLLALWAYVGGLLQSYRYFADGSALKIVPAQGKSVLFSSSEVVRLGEQKIVPSEDDWQFLGDHLSVLNQNWPRYLTTQKRAAESNKDNSLKQQVERASHVFEEIDLDEPSDTGKVIDTVAASFFVQKGVTLSDSVRLAQIAAKLGAQIGDNFRFVSRDRHFRSVDDIVLYDEDGSLDLLLPDEWAEEHLLHGDYTKAFSSCTAQEWQAWIANGRSGLANFVAFDEKRKWFWSTRDAKAALSTRRFAGRFEPRYSNPDFYLDDWDFEDGIWSHWESISSEMPTVWAQVAERLLSAPRQITAYQTGMLTERASNGHTRRMITRGLTPAWAMRLADKPCLRDTHGTHRKPTELLMRAPETEALMDVEPFVHKSLDSEATKALLKLLGVSDQPTGPEKLLARLSALASAKSAPAHEVDKWYRRLDQLIDGCSTEIFRSISATFRMERLILTEAGTWEGSEGVFLNAGDDEIPDAPVIRASVRDLTLWRKIGVGDRPTGELIMRWLTKLESGNALSPDDARRVRGLLPRFPVRIWNECAHWPNLAGEWAPVSDLRFSISMQTLAAFSHLHPWVKTQTADLRLLPVDAVESLPFSQLPPLSAQIDERVELGQYEDGEGEPRPWLQELGRMLMRVKLEEGEEADKLRALAAQLSETLWHSCAALETLPYIDGKPAGTARRADVLWIGERLYAERKPLAKLAKSVAQEIGKAFRRADIVDAIKLCFDRDAAFVRSYMEENFELLAAADVPKIDRPVNSEEPASKAAPERAAPQSDNSDERHEDNGIVDANPDADHEDTDTQDASVDITDPDDTSEDTDHSQATVVQPRKPRDVKPHIMERFALTQGFRKDGDGSFFNDHGCTIGKANGASFPWEQRSQDGDAIKFYWPKDHCLEREPLELDAVIWGMLERGENYVLVLSNADGEPIEVSGHHLIQLRDREVLALHPATYRLVIEHDKNV